MAETPRNLQFFDPAERFEIPNRPDYTEIASASFSLGWKVAPLDSAMRFIEVSSANRTDDITPHQELNEMFPFVEVPWSEPASLAQAKVIAQHALEKIELQKVIQRGGDSTVNSLITFGTGLLAQAVDPINILSGVGISRVMAAGLIRGVQLSNLSRNIVAGVAGNVITEAAFVIPASLQDREDINLYENLAHAVAGGVAFPAVLAGIKGTYKVLKGLTVDQMSKALTLTEIKMDSGRSPEISNEELMFLGDKTPDKLNAKLDDLELRRKLLVEEKFDTTEIDAEIEVVGNDLIESEKFLFDDVDMREQANDKQRDMFYNEKAEEAVRDIDDIEEIPRSEQIEAGSELRIKNELVDKLDEVELGQVKQIVSDANIQVKTMNLAIEKASGCLGGR